MHDLLGAWVAWDQDAIEAEFRDDLSWESAW